MFTFFSLFILFIFSNSQDFIFPLHHHLTYIYKDVTRFSKNNKFCDYMDLHFDKQMFDGVLCHFSVLGFPFPVTHGKGISDRGKWISKP
jgi:hypothetical protein